MLAARLVRTRLAIAWLSQCPLARAQQPFSDGFGPFGGDAKSLNATRNQKRQQPRKVELKSKKLSEPLPPKMGEVEIQCI